MSASTTELSADPGVRPRRRFVAPWWVLAAIGVTVLVLAAVGLTSGSGSSLARDPANPGPRGAQALAEVLAAHGVPVTVARSKAELARAGIDLKTTVFVSTPDRLSTSLIADLRGSAAGSAALVVLSPDQAVVTALTPGVSSRPAGPPPASLVATCDTAAIKPGDGLSRADREYTTAGVGTACFQDPSAPRWSVYLSVAGPEGTPVVYLGASSAVTNAEVAASNNAGVLLRLLGAGDRVVWYVPDPADAAVTDTAPATDYVPPWTASVIGLLALTVLALMLTRGRRFGRLVTEPLPVVVRAIETTRARGRIYLRAKDFERSTALLQQASANRLARALALPNLANLPGGGLDALAEAVAARTGREVSEVRSILGGPARQEQDMLVIAAALAALEKEIRQR